MTASTESAAPAAKTVHIQVHRIYSKNQREMVLYGTCSNMLFPYVGVMINQILAQSSLQPLYLAPMDFIPLYRRHQQQQQTKAQQEREQQNAVIQ